MASVNIKIPNDKDKVALLKDIIQAIKADTSDTKCIFRTTQEPDKKTLDKLEKVFGKKPETEVLDKDTYLGGAEIIFDGKIYSSLVKKRINEITTHLINNDGN